MKNLYNKATIIIDFDTFTSISSIIGFSRAIIMRLFRKLNLIKASDETIEFHIKDHILPFVEYPNCDMCCGNMVKEIMITKDGARIVECIRCGLYFTSPRISESEWEKYLQSMDERNEEFTENRLKYGVALRVNKKYSFPNWRIIKSKINNRKIDIIEEHLGHQIQRLHDIGCGVGFLLEDAKKRGIDGSGNELNMYACSVMKERLGLDVYNDLISNVDIEHNSLDAIVMNDYLEHTYHPLKDLKVAHTLLRNEGVIYICTFHIDCKSFDRYGKDWNMLFWNHIYHFSTTTLSNMINEAGFTIQSVQSNYSEPLIEIVAKKTVNT